MGEAVGCAKVSTLWRYPLPFTQSVDGLDVHQLREAGLMTWWPWSVKAVGIGLICLWVGLALEVGLLYLFFGR